MDFIPHREGIRFTIKALEKLIGGRFIKIGKLRIRRIMTPGWEWERRDFGDGSWQHAIGRILVYTVRAEK